MGARARSGQRRLLASVARLRAPLTRSVQAPTDPPVGIPARALEPDLGPAPAPATEHLYDRLRDQDLNEIDRRLSAEHRAIWDVANTLERHRLALAFGLAYGVEGVAQRTGLTDAHPPDHVHSMVRGLEHTGGAYEYADLVLEWLARAGQNPRSRR